MVTGAKALNSSNTTENQREVWLPHPFYLKVIWSNLCPLHKSGWGEKNGAWVCGHIGWGVYPSEWNLIFFKNVFLDPGNLKKKLLKGVWGCLENSF